MDNLDFKKTQKKINAILNDPNKFFPYFRKGQPSDNVIKVLGAVSASSSSITLEQALEIYHNSIKQHYHDRTGTEPIDLSPYM